MSLPTVAAYIGPPPRTVGSGNPSGDHELQDDYLENVVSPTLAAHRDKINEHEGRFAGHATLDADGDVPATQLDKVRAVPAAARIVTAAATVTAADDLVYYDSASAGTITIGSDVVAPTIVQIGAGQVTLAAGTGVILQGNLKTAGQWQGVSVFPKPGAAGTFIVVGGVA